MDEMERDLEEAISLATERSIIRAEVCEEISRELESHVNDLDSPDPYCVGFDKGLLRSAEGARRIGNNQTPLGEGG